MATGTFALTRRKSQAAIYDEGSFRYLLAIERARAERANRSMLLLLVSVRQPTARLMLRRTAPAIFSSFASSLREVDFFGWLRDGRLAAAVLVQAGACEQDVSRLVTERVMQALGKRLPTRVLQGLRLRVINLGGQTRC